MLILVSAMLIAGGPVPPSVGDIFYGHAMGHNDPVDYNIRPPKVPDCRTDEQIREAQTQKEKGGEPSCILPKVVPAAQPKD